MRRGGEAFAQVAAVRLTALASELVREQLEYRELLVRITARDLLLRYKQTVMGLGWALFMPLLNTAIFGVVFTRVAPVETPVPYPIFAFCGLLAWNWFASSLRFAVTSLSSNANLVTKVYFPREILPFSAVIVGFVDLLVASVVLVAMMAYYGMSPGWAILWLPVVIVVQLLFTAAVALVLAMANLFYRDVKYLFEVAITIWMFATSVVYPIDLIGGRLGYLLSLNPMTHIVNAWRAVLLQGAAPAMPEFAGTAAIAVAACAVAWAAFHAAEFRFAENV
jgi:lipopolysaccharide transport system permease protein